jgi:hypothetical protein
MPATGGPGSREHNGGIRKGRNSSSDGRDGHPATHVAWQDAALTIPAAASIASACARGCPEAPHGGAPLVSQLLRTPLGQFRETLQASDSGRRPTAPLLAPTSSTRPDRRADRGEGRRDCLPLVKGGTADRMPPSSGTVSWITRAASRLNGFLAWIAIQGSSRIRSKTTMVRGVAAVPASGLHHSSDTSHVSSRRTACVAWRSRQDLAFR